MLIGRKGTSKNAGKRVKRPSLMMLMTVRQS
jgi:hypothetical protein